MVEVGLLGPFGRADARLRKDESTQITHRTNSRAPFGGQRACNTRLEPSKDICNQPLALAGRCIA